MDPMLGGIRSSMAEILHSRVNKVENCKKYLSIAADRIVKFRFPAVLGKLIMRDEPMKRCQLTHAIEKVAK